MNKLARIDHEREVQRTEDRHQALLAAFADLRERLDILAGIVTDALTPKEGA